MFDWSVILHNFAAAGFNACIVMIVYLIVALLFGWFVDERFLERSAWAAITLGLLVFFVTLITRQWQ